MAHASKNTPPITLSQFDLSDIEKQLVALAQIVLDLKEENEVLKNEIAFITPTLTHTFDFTSTLPLRFEYGVNLPSRNFLTSLIPNDNIEDVAYLTMAWGQLLDLIPVNSTTRMRYQLAMYQSDEENAENLQFIALSRFWTSPAVGEGDLVANTLYGVSFELNQPISLVAGKQYYVCVYMQFQGDSGGGVAILAGQGQIATLWPTNLSSLGYRALSFPTFKINAISDNGVPEVIEPNNYLRDGRGIWIMASKTPTDITNITIPWDIETIDV